MPPGWGQRARLKDEAFVRALDGAPWASAMSCPAPRRTALLGAAWLALLAGCAGARPVQSDELRPPQLVELVLLDASVHLDIRYATSKNFTGRVMYGEARAFLQRPAAEALVRAHRELKAQGYGLLIYDAYRPWSVTRTFWEVTPPEKRKFVADPRKGSRHNRGCAVDVGLYDLETGREVPMPSTFDEFSDRAAAAYAGGTAEERRTREVLRAALEKEGFAVNPDEWWHFDYRDWAAYPVLDLPFADLVTRPDAGTPLAR